MRFSIPIMANTIHERLMEKQWKIAAPAAPYQRGQHWVRRFTQQAEPLSLALAAITAVNAVSSFISKTLGMLDAIGWVRAHRFLLSDLRVHLLGWGRTLAPHGRRIIVNAALAAPKALPQNTCTDWKKPSG
jgi:hypothetical protein